MRRWRRVRLQKRLHLLDGPQPGIHQLDEVLRREDGGDAVTLERRAAHESRRLEPGESGTNAEVRADAKREVGRPAASERSPRDA